VAVDPKVTIEQIVLLPLCPARVQPEAMNALAIFNHIFAAVLVKEDGTRCSVSEATVADGKTVWHGVVAPVRWQLERQQPCSRSPNAIIEASTPGAIAMTTMTTTTTTDIMLSEIVALLESLSARSAELAATLPSLDLPAEDLAALAGEVERISGWLVDVEERLASAGPVDRRG